MKASQDFFFPIKKIKKESLDKHKCKNPRILMSKDYKMSKQFEIYFSIHIKAGRVQKSIQLQICTKE